MKIISLPGYPIMYKMNFIKGRSMKFQFDDFLFSYVYSGEGTMRVTRTDYPLSKGLGWILARNEPITFYTETSMQVIYIRISEDAVTEYLLRAVSPAAFVANKGMNDEDAHVLSVSNHVLLQGLVSGIEAGVDNNFRANEPLTYLKIQECINVLTLVYESVPPLESFTIISLMCCISSLKVGEDNKATSFLYTYYIGWPILPAVVFGRFSNLLSVNRKSTIHIATVCSLGDEIIR